MNIKEVFEKSENGTLTYDQFLEATKDAKFADLAEGGYVAKKKYEDDLQAKATEIEGLNTTLGTRDADLTKLKEQLAAAGTDASKLSELSANLETLQGQYNADTKALQDKLNAQAYEFAVKEFAASKNFTSNAAKRDFVNSMIAKNLPMNDKGSILGAEDFVADYTTDNADAFVVEKPAEPPAPDTQKPTPHFAASTGGTPTPQPAGDGGFNFNFVGIRPH